MWRLIFVKYVEEGNCLDVAFLLCWTQQWSVGLITLPNNFEKILDKTEKKKIKKVEIDDNNNNSSSTEDGDRIGLEVKIRSLRFFL